jgi:aspartyl-tRNA(Asn)/glutamyl-tRNA(Gln) amidotransferase subunit A
MNASACEIARRVRSRQVSAAEVVEEALAAIERVNGDINAFVGLNPDAARRAARDVDRRVAGAERLPLAGVPVAIKDNLCVGPDLREPGDGLGFGGRTTCASRILENYHSPFSATCVQRLIDAGAVIVGKTNLDEFAMGSSTERSIFGPSRNPHDRSRVCGGSSGGSAAAVAAGVVPLALGSDTGGSIRQPASHCGIVGVKPTYGRVSRYGLVAFASSLDQAGPMTRCVADAAIALDVLCAHDPLDATSVDLPPAKWAVSVEEPVEHLRVGVPRQAYALGLHAGVTKVLEAALDALRAQGANVLDVDLPLTDVGIAAYYIIATAEASSNLARFDGVRYGRRAVLREGEGMWDLFCRSRGEGFGTEVKRRILLGTHVLSAGYAEAYYLRALRVRRRVLEDFRRALTLCDVIMMPAAPGPAFRIGERLDDPLAMYLEDVFTVGVNLAGLPAMVVPAGHVRDDGSNLPVGVQIVAPAFEEGRMLRVGRMVEREMSSRGGQPFSA